MATAAGPSLPAPQISLFEHARRLHVGHPDSPLPRDGYPFPDDPLHRDPGEPEPWPRAGAKAAAILDGHFARSDAEPADLEFAFHDVGVPIHWNEHIAAAAWRADVGRVRETGRWLVMRSRDRCSATIGLALLGSGPLEDGDSTLVRTIGLLSNHFGPLAARILRHPLADSDLLWLANRVSGWGRVYVIEALCEYAPGWHRSWLLRHSCDGDFLNGYFAGKVATVAYLQEAIADNDTDDDLTDHTSLLLHAMADCDGMGMTLSGYPPARAVIAAHIRLLGQQQPTFDRWVTAAHLAARLASIRDQDETSHDTGFTPAERQRLADAYAAVLNRADWTVAADATLKKDGNRREQIARATQGIQLNVLASPPDGA